MEPLTPARSCPDAGADALRWYVPQGTDRHSSADAWCRSVGPAVLQLDPTLPTSPGSADTALVVTAWNVNGGSGDLYRFLATELGLDCLGDRPYGGPPFVLLLQEAYRRSAEVPAAIDSGVVPPRMKEPDRPGIRDDVVAVARRCGLALAYVPATRNGVEQYDGQREDKGNAILTTVPLSDPVAIELPMVAQRRVALAAIAELPVGGALRVVSVHLNNYPGPGRVLATGGGTREQQAAALLAALEQEDHREPAGTGSLATVAGGDLNTSTTRATALRVLREYFTASPPYHGKPTRSGFPTDHLLLREGAGGAAVRVEPGSYRRIDDACYSDHNPVTLTLRVEGTAR